MGYPKGMGLKIPEVIPQSAAERELLARLARGEQEIAAGQGADLDTVLAEAEAILNRRDS